MAAWYIKYCCSTIPVVITKKIPKLRKTCRLVAFVTLTVCRNADRIFRQGENGACACRPSVRPPARPRPRPSSRTALPFAARGFPRERRRKQRSFHSCFQSSVEAIVERSACSPFPTKAGSCFKFQVIQSEPNTKVVKSVAQNFAKDYLLCSSSLRHWCWKLQSTFSGTFQAWVTMEDLP